MHWGPKLGDTSPLFMSRAFTMSGLNPEPFIAGHERVMIQSEPPARGSYFQFWRSTVNLAKEPFSEISVGERRCTFAGPDV